MVETCSWPLETIAQGGERAMGYIIAWALGVPVTVLVVWFLIKNVL